MALARETAKAQPTPGARAALRARVLLDALRLARWNPRALLNAERDRWLLWLPAAFGAGIVAYLALAREPPLLAAPALAAFAYWGALKAKALWTPRPEIAFACGLLAAFAAGFFWIQLRANLAAQAPVVTRGTHEVTGPIAAIEPREGGYRLTIDPATIERRGVTAQAARVRLTVRGEVDDVNGLALGAVVALRGNLSPPSGPSAPGGHDFRLPAFFDRLGGIGWAYGPPELIAPAPEAAPLGLAAARRAIEAARLRIAVAARASSEGDPGAVTAALLTGHRGAISDEAWRDMQTAGLAHLLAISGLHVGLAAGAVFMAARGVLAFLPSLTLRVPAQKIAAAAALAGAFAYVLLTGGTTPTQRAFVMAAIALIGVMVGREAISMRLVAIAAALVMVLDPAAVIGASFQMSFAAVIALIAAYEWARARGPSGRWPGPAGVAARYVAGVALTTLVASVATAAFSIFHFQRVALTGSFANLLAVPITAFWIMPAGMIALALEPLGLAEPFYAATAFGVEQVLRVAAIAAAAPHAAANQPQWPGLALGLIALGGLWLCLWLRSWRWLGLAPIALGAFLGANAPRWELLVDRRAKLVGLGDPQFGLAISDWRKDGWIEGQWRRALGEPPLASWPEPWRALSGEGSLRCDPWGCVYAKEGAAIAVALRAEATAEDCARASLALALYGAARCLDGSAQLIDRPRLWRMGGLAARIEDGEILWRAIDDRAGARLWTRK